MPAMSEHKHDDCAECLRRDNFKLAARVAELELAVAADAVEFDELKPVETYEQAMAALRLFWQSEARPWFCRVCHTGRLQPFGREGYKCARDACRATYCNTGAL